MIDSEFWSWALIAVFLFTLCVYVYIIVFSKSSKRLQKRLFELQQKEMTKSGE